MLPKQQADIRCTYLCSTCFCFVVYVNISGKYLITKLSLHSKKCTVHITQFEISLFE